MLSSLNPYFLISGVTLIDHHRLASRNVALVWLAPAQISLPVHLNVFFTSHALKRSQSVKSKTIIHPRVAPDTALLFSDWLSEWMRIHWEHRDALTHVFSELVLALPFTSVCSVHLNIGLKLFCFWFSLFAECGGGTFRVRAEGRSC